MDKWVDLIQNRDIIKYWLEQEDRKNQYLIDFFNFMEKNDNNRQQSDKN